MLESFSQWYTAHFGKFTWWEVFGFIGQMVFAGRFAVQWVASERKKASVIPIHFWYMSLTGSVMLLIYGIHIANIVIIVAYIFNSAIYVRNMMFIHRPKDTVKNTLTIK